MQTIRTLIAAAMAWAALGAGGGASEAGPARLLTALQGDAGGGYISTWNGQRISAQAMRQVW